MNIENIFQNCTVRGEGGWWVGKDLKSVDYIWAQREQKLVHEISSLTNQG